MLSLNTIKQIHDIVTVLNNTSKAINKEQPTVSFSQMLSDNIANDPTRQTMVIQETIQPKKKCRICGKDIPGGALCEECAQKRMKGEVK